MSHLVLRGLTRHHPGSPRPSLEGLELELHAGERVCLVGPSGCGKSTTLRLIAGLDTPTRGSIELDGRRLEGVPPQDRDVAMVFQGYALYPHLSVAENLAFPLRMRHMPREARERRVKDTASLLGLGNLLDRLPGELSGGERQRVAMGRALVREPKLFLFDEPLANLDAALRQELRVELGQLLGRLGTASLYVTHDQVEAMTLGDRIAILRAGRLEQVGTPREVYERPSSLFVAGFLGSPPMNLLEVHPMGGGRMGGGLGVQTPAGPVIFPRPSTPEPPSGRWVLGVRPEHLQVVGGLPTGRVTPPDSFASSFEAPLQGLEPLGAETLVHLELGGTRWSLRAAGFLAAAPGTLVRVTYAPERLHAFDAHTGVRLGEDGPRCP